MARIWPVRTRFKSLVYFPIKDRRNVAQSRLTLSCSRYYVLVAICVLARKKVWLRNACLPPALLFPAVAALHGIVLAAVHVDGECILRERLLSAPRLTGVSSRCRRYGRVWRFPVMRDRHLGRTGNRDKVKDVFFRPRPERYLLVDRSPSCW